MLWLEGCMGEMSEKRPRKGETSTILAVLTGQQIETDGTEQEEIKR